MAPKQKHVKPVATNRKARHKYSIEDTFEAGLELTGSEVKSLRQGTCSIDESFARPKGRELYVVAMHIPPYAQATIDVPDPRRDRRLLLHRREMDRIIARCNQRGYTLVPLSVYFKEGWVKVELALARSKKLGDKREKELKKQRQQDVDSALGRRSGRRSNR
jgi:SsrA-binding protein